MLGGCWLRRSLRICRGGAWCVSEGGGCWVCLGLGNTGAWVLGGVG